VQRAALLFTMDPHSHTPLAKCTGCWMLDAGYWILVTGSWFHPLQLLILLFPMAVAVVLDETVEDDDVDDDVAGPTKQFFRNEMSWACHPLPLPPIFWDRPPPPGLHFKMATWMQESWDPGSCGPAAMATTVSIIRLHMSLAGGKIKGLSMELRMGMWSSGKGQNVNNKFAFWHCSWAPKFSTHTHTHWGTQSRRVEICRGEGAAAAWGRQSKCNQQCVLLLLPLSPRTGAKIRTCSTGLSLQVH